MRVDLGCGNKKMKGCIGVDIAPLEGVDIVHDLRSYPYPFEDNSIDYINMDSIIEHLPDTFRVMEEIHRILKPGGIVRIITGYWNHHDSISSPQHVTFFDEKTWQYFTREHREYYFKGCFEILSLKYIYDYKNKYYFLCFKPLMNFMSKFLCNIKAGMEVVMMKVDETKLK